MEMSKNAKGVVSLVVMLALVMLATTPKSTFAVRPLSNIMLEEFGINANPLACVGYNEHCGPAYWCCGKCYCDYVFSVGWLACTTPAFDTSGRC